MLVQCVCDHRLLYRDVYCGQPGSIEDARNFQRSPLSINLLTQPDLLSDGQHILGDGAYTCSNRLLTPYLDDRHLTQRQRNHNYLLSACRSKIENSFALLRGKERRMKFLPMRNVELVNGHMVASCVIHNFIILEGNEMEGLPPFQPRYIPDNEFERLSQDSVEAGIH